MKMLHMIVTPSLYFLLLCYTVLDFFPSLMFSSEITTTDCSLAVFTNSMWKSASTACYYNSKVNLTKLCNKAWLETGKTDATGPSCAETCKRHSSVFESIKLFSQVPKERLKKKGWRRRRKNMDTENAFLDVSLKNRESVLFAEN